MKLYRNVKIGQYLQAGSPVCSAVDYMNARVTANFKETQIEDMRLTNRWTSRSMHSHPPRSQARSSFGGATGAKFNLLPPDNATGNFVAQRVPCASPHGDPKELEGMLMPGERDRGRPHQIIQP
ncbi:MAG: hypothetical protein U0176_20980 [Bacteroidia bacterium]